MYRAIRGTLPLGFLGSVYVVIWLSSPAVFAAALDGGKAISIVDPLRDAVYGQLLDEDGMTDLHKSTVARLKSEIEDDVERLHARILSDYYRGRFYQDIRSTDEMLSYAADIRAGRYLAVRRYYNRREPALESYRAALTGAETFLGSRPDAEAHRLYGEILGQMVFLGTVADAIFLGPKALKHVETARQLDPTHLKALIQEASRYAYSPAIYGGDPEKSRDLFREALRYGGGDREDRFNIYGGFAMAAFMEEDDPESLYWFERALQIFPGNAFAAGMAAFCREEVEG
jgi:tetratricopeptide (TPR) repeat protein